MHCVFGSLQCLLRNKEPEPAEAKPASEVAEKRQQATPKAKSDPKEPKAKKVKK